MKPVDLIVAVRAHEIMNAIDRLPDDARARFAASTACGDTFADQLRTLLCDIAHQGTAATVARALAAVGAPATSEALQQRVAAARERMQREASQ